jgi:hypothetical protein
MGIFLYYLDLGLSMSLEFKFFLGKLEFTWVKFGRAAAFANSNKTKLACRRI